MTDVHTLDRLFAVIQSRKGADPETSYTAKLFSQGTLKIAKKLGEEGVETALAAVAQGPEALAAELADLLITCWFCGRPAGLNPPKSTVRSTRVHTARALRKKRHDENDYVGVPSTPSARLLIRSITRLRTLPSLMRMKARLSWSPSPLDRNSMTGGLGTSALTAPACSAAPS